ncbi:MAG: hypothetical protein HY063_06355 [Bacteroidetes bacterium]|nr:hypothetical protein [Bacteroidota bacterium]
MNYKAKALKAVQALLAKQKMLRKKNKHKKQTKNVIPASPKQFTWTDIKQDK